MILILSYLTIFSMIYILCDYHYHYVKDALSAVHCIKDVIINLDLLLKTFCVSN